MIHWILFYRDLTWGPEGSASKAPYVQWVCGCREDGLDADGGQISDNKQIPLLSRDSLPSPLPPLAHLEVLPQLVHHPSVLAADLLAPGAAVAGVVADMDARGRQRGALGAGARGALGRALALGAVVRVQEVPFPHVVDAAVGLTGVLRLPGHREAPAGPCAEQQRQNGCA